jgi:hypothetical protein
MVRCRIRTIRLSEVPRLSLAAYRFWPFDDPLGQNPIRIRSRLQIAIHKSASRFTYSSVLRLELRPLFFQLDRARVLTFSQVRIRCLSP